MKREDALKLRTDIKKMIIITGVFESQNLSKGPFEKPLPTSQMMALEELEVEKLTVWQLSNKLRLETSTVSRLVDKLVKKGLIYREVNEKNRRELFLHLTEKGHITVNCLREQSITFYQSILNNLSESEQKIVVDGFELFIDSISKSFD
ncbi:MULTISPECIES: MarR family winged helix-turn-helix transcriptional regulator [Bacillus cereus group]|uniref:MarR family winged helix-turn-helix transcriptional regulator n=1 Tax=Bacillus cereus group TaxID=86661 RepID=UPI0008FDDED7|nr:MULTISPECIES: MarR family transcriptional regulator [Bacillus cereus group]MDG1622019.1 MarR family transcriptional regulator [Bacillus mobilis]MDX5836377.1 MarR family transcriptional regulator [Bacillus cereus group sp. BfR-BA-01700]OJE37338.1 MarR family transcriptional regulator [Bacillus mobilis]HDR7244628.1 MarR family transcriptional regulator [Bacillus mobilis]